MSGDGDVEAYRNNLGAVIGDVVAVGAHRLRPSPLYTLLNTPAVESVGIGGGPSGQQVGSIGSNQQ